LWVRTIATDDCNVTAVLAVQLFGRFGERVRDCNLGLESIESLGVLIMLKAPSLGSYSRIDHMARALPAPIIYFL
jgi:hypothetical protein